MDLSVYEAQSPAHNDFRSDTFTTPTPAMIQLLGTATLGDAVYDEDTATTELEQKVADLAGKEAGLFCVSGTLSNQLGIRVNLHQPPHSVLCDHRAHVYVHEAGGMATLSQAMPQTIGPKNGTHLTLEDDILPAFIPDDGEIHSAPTKLICLENTLHGMLFPIDEIARISDFCKKNNVRLHLDGARLWNASVETGVLIKEYCLYFDSVSLCFSKGLGAPVGSVLVGDRKFINKANHFRKQNGGGIRQSGLLARMASVAIDETLPKLKRTHQQAKELAQHCIDHGIPLEHPTETNFVFADLHKAGIDQNVLIQRLKHHDVKISSSRIAFHHQISDESAQKAKLVLTEALEESKKLPSLAHKVSKFYNSIVEK